ncbi:hypothetical protein K7711_37730 [Nocardia sp. CA2R105]|uniref:hypothetical protein n=1 Tax=Nocardia coffeae TaxID=2873381 RepID=UPI001CA767A2|nr:hypothetical protein [Nocardia coffeae]MBY8862263.1 hypothetical protein [Nocardia coffeae]
MLGVESAVDLKGGWSFDRGVLEVAAQPGTQGPQRPVTDLDLLQQPQDGPVTAVGCQCLHVLEPLFCASAGRTVIEYA